MTACRHLYRCHPAGTARAATASSGYFTAPAEAFCRRAAIRAFLAGWMTSYGEYAEEMQEVLDLGNGIAFATVRESAVPLGSTARARVHSVYGFAVVWVDGKIARITAYPNADEARAAAERLAAAGE